MGKKYTKKEYRIWLSVIFKNTYFSSVTQSLSEEYIKKKSHFENLKSLAGEYIKKEDSENTDSKKNPPEFGGLTFYIIVPRVKSKKIPEI